MWTKATDAIVLQNLPLFPSAINSAVMFGIKFIKLEQISCFTLLYRVSQKKFPLLKFIALWVLDRFEWFEFQLKAERSKCFLDFSHCFTGAKGIGKFNWIKIKWVSKWLKNGLKHRSNCNDSLNTEQYAIGVSPLGRVIRHQWSNKYWKIFNPTAINVQRISLTHEELLFLYGSVRGVHHDLINVLGHFQSFCNHEIFVKSNLPTYLVLLRQREKSQKYFDLLAFNWNLNHSNLWRTLGAINFQKWEHFSGSPSI